MPLRREPSFFRRGLMTDAARAACIGYAAIVDDGGVTHDRLVHIGVVNDRSIHAHHSGVVREAVSAPFAAHKADAHVAEAIVDAAVKSNVRTPISDMPTVHSADEAPIPRGP